MLFIKNTFVIISSIFVISILIVIFNNFGMNNNFNLIFSALLYGLFVTLYFKTYILSLVSIGAFYSSLFAFTNSFEVIGMLLLSFSVLIIVKMIMPKLKNENIEHMFLKEKQNS
ncbi:hypothetical protein ACG9ZB_16045 [Acinetobacter johnsonii]|uniref:hypothetical protein n=1 Tax=Acinetobacter johnsonii TaxID=40214 RepID=UPI003AF89DF8